MRRTRQHQSVHASLAALPAGAPSLRLQAQVFAGELTSAALRNLAEIATAHAGGLMVLTCDQNVAFHLAETADAAHATASLAKAGFCGTSREERVRFRICPGNHECRLGLAPTRDVAAEIISAMDEAGEAIVLGHRRLPELLLATATGRRGNRHGKAH